MFSFNNIKSATIFILVVFSIILVITFITIREILDSYIQDKTFTLLIVFSIIYTVLYILYILNFLSCFKDYQVFKGKWNDISCGYNSLPMNVNITKSYQIVALYFMFAFLAGVLSYLLDSYNFYTIWNTAIENAEREGWLIVLQASSLSDFFEARRNFLIFLINAQITALIILIALEFSAIQSSNPKYHRRPFVYLVISMAIDFISFILAITIKITLIDDLSKNTTGDMFIMLIALIGGLFIFSLISSLYIIVVHTQSNEYFAELQVHFQTKMPLAREGGQSDNILSLWHKLWTVS